MKVKILVPIAGKLPDGKVFRLRSAMSAICLMIWRAR